LSAKYNLELSFLAVLKVNKFNFFFPIYAWDDIYNPLDIWAAIEQVGANKVYKVAGEVFLEVT